MPDMISSGHLDKISLFLDTTIPVSQIIKGEDFRKRIDYLLSQFRWLSTSSYSQLEYGSRILAECEYLIAKLHEIGSFKRTMDWVINVLPKQQKRKQIITLNLLTKIFGNDDKECMERALYELTDLMELGTDYIQNCYLDKTIEKVDGTQCYWISRALVLKKDRWHWIGASCKKENKRCNIDKFFQDNIDIFKAIALAISKLPKPSNELMGFKNIIELAQQDPAILLDYKNCKALADAIIAVDSNGHKSFFSQNIYESQTLCSVMGQIFYYLPPNFQKGIEVYDQSGTILQTLHP